MRTKSKQYRPRYSEIRRLAAMHVTIREAAAFFGVKEKKFREMITKDLRAAQIWETGQAEGKIALRRRQIRMADMSPQMAIFLGKQWLGQSDIQVHEHSGLDGGPIQHMDLKQLDHEERAKLRQLIGRAKKSE